VIRMRCECELGETLWHQWAADIQGPLTVQTILKLKANKPGPQPKAVRAVTSSFDLTRRVQAFWI